MNKIEITYREREDDKSLTFTILDNNAKAFINIFLDDKATAKQSWQHVKKVVDKILKEEN